MALKRAIRVVGSEQPSNIEELWQTETDSWALKRGRIVERVVLLVWEGQEKM
jgi:hypothetical protein